MEPVLALGWLVTAFLVAGRIAGVIMTMPAIGIQGVPATAKIAAVVVLTGLIAPVAGGGPTPPTVTMLVLGMASETLIGVTMGGVVRLAFGTLHVATEAISTQIGHGAAAMFDPMTQSSSNPLGSLASFLAGLVFLGTDLHLVFLSELGRSFLVVGPGLATDPIAGGRVWADMVGWVIVCGIRMAAPILTMVFMINLFVSVITKLAPSMNIFFALGLVLTICAGLALFHVSLPQMLELHHDFVREAVGRAFQVIQQVGGPDVVLVPAR